MKLDELERVLGQVRTRPLRSVLMLVLLLAVGVATVYVTHYVGARAESSARHRSVDPPTIGSPDSTGGAKRTIDGPTIRVRVQSANRGQGRDLLVPRAASVSYLSDAGSEALGLSTAADVGGFRDFRVRWVVIQREAVEAWRSLKREQQEDLYGLFVTEGSLVKAVDPYASLGELGLRDGVVLHLAAVEDEDVSLTVDVDVSPEDRDE
jgi:hypothetical protein